MEESFYHEVANQQMQKLLDLAEGLEESHNLEAEYEAGVLTITLPNTRQYVINRHTPSRQIWVSSPVSGAGYYEFSGSSWLSKRADNANKSELYNFISAELNLVLAKA
jgi:frataxin